MIVTIAAALVILYVLSKWYNSSRLKKRELAIREQAMDAAFTFLAVQCWEHIKIDIGKMAGSFSAANQVLHEAEKQYEETMNANLEKIYRQVYIMLNQGLSIDLPANSENAIVNKVLFESMEKSLREQTMEAIANDAENLAVFKKSIRDYDMARTIGLMMKQKVLLEKEFVY